MRERFGIVTPLGTARYRYLSAVGAVKLEFAAPKPSPLGKVAERKRGRMRISHFAEMRVDIEHCTALIRLAFGDPPSPKGKALVRQITIFITVMVEGPKGCCGIDRVRNALAAGPARQIPIYHSVFYTNFYYIMQTHKKQRFHQFT